MSIYVVGLSLVVKFGTPTRKSVFLKLAECANDDGTRIYPALSTVAWDSEADIATVRKYIRSWQRIELIEQIREGGGGPGDSSEYAINMSLLTLLHNYNIRARKAAKLEIAFPVVRVMDYKDKAGLEHDLKAGLEPDLNEISRAWGLNKSGLGPDNPSIDPNIPPKSPKGDRFLSEMEEVRKELGGNQYMERVLDKFVIPMAKIISPPRRKGVEFYVSFCEQLRMFAEGALEETVSVLSRTVNRFPTTKQAYDIAKELQGKYLVVVTKKGKPAAWAAWQAYYADRKKGNRAYQSKQMREGEIQEIKVPTEFPPII